MKRKQKNQPNLALDLKWICPCKWSVIVLKLSMLLAIFFLNPMLSYGQNLPKEIITVAPGTWRSATVFTHVIWKDLLFYGGGSGADGGDPRHEIEIGVFHLITSDSGYHDARNPIVTRRQFGLDKPGQGITPLSIFDRGDSLFMFCTSRPTADLNPQIVVISASIDNPYRWQNYKKVIGKSLSGKENNHGASAIIDPDDPNKLLVYFAALSGKEDYRILLAEIQVPKISDPTAYKLIRNYDHAVLQRENVKANYPFVRYLPESEKYELWYSGQSIGNPVKRSCFRSISDKKDSFDPATVAVLDPSEIDSRNDHAYATGPKVYGTDLYYSGRKEKNGNYLSIFHTILDSND